MAINNALSLYRQAATVRFVVLSIISVIFMTLDHRLHYFDNLRAGLGILVYPIHLLVSFPLSAGHWAEQNITSHDVLLEEKNKLQTQNTYLKVQLQKLISLEMENMRLRRLLGASEKVLDRVLIAELLSVDLDTFSHKVLINKGSRQDLYVGQPLLDADGVYGQVVGLNPLYSTVMLISDPSHATPIQVNRNGLRAIAAGMGNSYQLRLLNMPNNADIIVGDLLVSSGLGGVFPAGYPVAKITSVKLDTSQPYATVLARPLAALDRTKEVMLVWNERYQRDDVIVDTPTNDATALVVSPTSSDELSMPEIIP